MEFRFDFSGVDLVSLRQLNIHAKEVVDIFSYERSFHGNLGFNSFLIGFSNKRKFIRAAYRVAKNPNFDVEILQVDLPNESDIQNFWCKGS